MSCSIFLPACHRHVLRGTFPPHDSHYQEGGRNRPYGFTTASGQSIRVNHFQLIDRNRPRETEPLTAAGGWHDAADWDRRPQHLGIVADLAAVYLMKPENFSDGQLNLPESANGIPDILDEAVWGLRHLLALQQPDGGVGTWIETIRHPRPEDGSPAQDILPWFLSCATRQSSLEYASSAALLALALRRAGAAKEAETYYVSARKAWDYALNPLHRRPRMFHDHGEVIFYREAPECAPEFLVKAGFALYQFGKDPVLLNVAANASGAALRAMRKESWRWSPLFWIELELFPDCPEELLPLREARRRALLEEADRMLDQLENNYPVRIAWHGAQDSWVHTMSWGTYHPLRRARVWIAAHAITGNRVYRDAALLANDFHNGANPTGRTMTSGLGKVYPVLFLDLNSYADGIAEFVPGITPYGNTWGIPRNAVKMAYGLYYPANPGQHFDGLARSFLPREGLSEAECAAAVARTLPVWRRWCNVEGETVPASEYSVWETIAPAAAVTGYLLNGARPPEPEWTNRRPADDIRRLPGYAHLP